MKKLFFLLFSFLLLASSHLKAQYEIDFGIQLGSANYLGEIGGGSDEGRAFLLDVELESTSFSVGGFFRSSFSRNFALRISGTYARIEGADSLSDNPQRIGRNLSFRTDLIEASLIGEYNFITLRDISRRSRQKIDFKAYAFGGVGALLFYPEAQENGEWFDLRPLQTEGAENAYDELTIAVPLGLGLNYTFNDKYRFGLEVGYRFTFTDYLDDISTRFASPEDLPYVESLVFANRSDEAFARGNPDLPNRGFYSPGSIRGNPDENDGYLLVQITASYVIKTGNNFYKPRYNSIINRKRKRTKF